MLAREELKRYARQLLLPELGASGQAKLKQSRVLLVGAGGLGGPAALYLAAAGVGRLTLLDPDHVSLSNLHRQILYTEADIGALKAERAAARLETLNGGVEIMAVPDALGEANAAALAASHDLVIDGSDSMEARFIANQAARRAGKPFLTAALRRWEAQLFGAAPGTACWRCLWPKGAAEESCDEAGILGPAAGAAGALLALEALKHLAAIPGALAGEMVLMDFNRHETQRLIIPPAPDCPICGK